MNSLQMFNVPYSSKERERERERGEGVLREGEGANGFYFVAGSVTPVL
jgi:hypothetical protein